MIVTCYDTGVCFAKHFAQHFGTAAGRDKGPEVTSFAFVLPAGFINIQGQGRSDILVDGADHRHTGIGGTPGSIADGAGGDGDAK